MHYNRMRAVRCSGRLPVGECLPGGVHPLDPEADTRSPGTRGRHPLLFWTVKNGDVHVEMLINMSPDDVPYR